MHNGLIQRLIGRVAGALCVLALLLVGWGHHPLRAGTDLSAFAMPDGSLPDLCGTVAGDQASLHAPCPACTLAKAVMLPCAPQAVRPAITARAVDWLQVAAHLTTTPLPRAPPARGPPAIL